MDGRKIFAGGTLAISAASLAVGSVALATQPKVPETSQVEQNPIIIPLGGEKPTINPEDIHKWINDGADQTKREINEGREKEILDLKGEISKAKVEASIASTNLNQKIKDINRNTEIFNKNFVSVDEKLTEALKKFQNKEKEYAGWKADIEEKMEEIEKKHKEIEVLYAELKTIKEVSDIGTATEYFQKTLKDYVDTRTLMNDLIERIKQTYPQLAH